MPPKRLLTLLILAGASGSAHGSSLLFGLVLGMMLNGGPTDQASRAMRESGLSGIPIRCLTVESEADYKDCRWTSMMAEIQAPRNNVFQESATPYCAGFLTKPRSWGAMADLRSDAKDHERACDVQWDIDLELKALKAMNESLAREKKD